MGRLFARGPDPTPASPECLGMERPCPILGRTTAVDVVDTTCEPWRLVRCRDTGFVYLANPPQYSQLVDEFAWERTCEAESARRRQAEPWVARVSDWIKATRRALFPHRNRCFSIASSALPRTSPLRLLDIGCGDGSVLSQVCRRYASRGIRAVPYGIEISRHLAVKAGEAFTALDGEALFTGATDGLMDLAAEYFDGILLWSYLEHERQPLDLLRLLPRVLKRDGAILVKVPNYACWNRRWRGRRWCGFRFPDHVNYFTPTTLAMLAAEAGLRMARQGLYERMPLNDSMYAVLRHGSALRA